MSHVEYDSTTAPIPVEAYLDVAGVMIVFITEDEEVALVNRKAQEVLGYSEEEILGKNWFDTFLPSSVRKRARGVFRELLSVGIGPHEYAENAVITSSGEERLIAWHNAVVTGGQGRPAGTLSSGLDLTEYRAREIELRESEARSGAILRTTVDAIITSDERGRIQSFNPAAERMFGYAVDEVVGENLNILMHSPHSEMRTGDLQVNLKWGRSEVFGSGREVVGRRKDGSTFPVELAVSEFTAGGRRYCTGVIRDISDRMALEREVLRIAEEERARIGRDLHDGLGSLLAGAAMGVQALVQKAEKGQSIAVSDLKRLADLLEEGAWNAHVLAQGLSPARLESKGLVSALTEIVRQAEEMAGISCTLSTSGDLSPLNKDVAVQLFRIAQEALNNAVKHARASSIGVALHRREGWLELAVRDDGIGLPAEGRNDGLGLHIMSYRARLIHGLFAIKPNEGGGTVVSCTVPLGIES